MTDMVSDESKNDAEVTSRVRWSNRDVGRYEKSSVRDFRKLFGKTNE